MDFFFWAPLTSRSAEGVSGVGMEEKGGQVGGEGNK